MSNYPGHHQGPPVGGSGPGQANPMMYQQGGAMIQRGGSGSNPNVYMSPAQPQAQPVQHMGAMQGMAGQMGMHPGSPMVQMPTLSSQQQSTPQQGPPSVGPSSNPQTPLMSGTPGSTVSSTFNTPQQQQQQQSTAQAYAEQLQLQSQNDPVAYLRYLIVKDLRQCLHELIKVASELLMQRTKTAHGPGSMNPASVTNPMSANPLSNYANPSSVKSTTDLEPKSVDNPSPEKAVASSKPPTSLQDQFQSAFDSFFAVCDKVEKQFMLIQEINKQARQFEKTIPQELKDKLAVTPNMDPNVLTYQQFAHSYVESANKVTEAVRQCLQNVAAQAPIMETNENSNDSDPLENAAIKRELQNDDFEMLAAD